MNKTERYHKNMTDVFNAPNKNAKKNIERHENHLDFLEQERLKKIEEERKGELDFE